MGHVAPDVQNQICRLTARARMNDRINATPMRIFVGMKIVLDIARELARLAESLKGFPVRLVSPADIHLTLVPPWRETPENRSGGRAFGEDRRGGR